MFNLTTKHITSSLLKTTSIHTITTKTTSKTSKTLPKILNHHPSPDPSFTVSYLTNTCNFPPEKAISTSKHLTLKNNQKPDSVITFFKKHGFTDTHLSKLFLKFPLALTCNPETNLLPKFEFLYSLGLTSCDIVKLLSARPKSLGRSLKKHLVPSVGVLRELLQSDDRTLIAIKRCAWVLDWDFHSNMIPNMEILREVGVPGEKMLYVLTYQPRDFLVGTEQFRMVVDEVVGFGFDPSRTSFMLAVHAIRSMTKATWEKKMEVYGKWGWSKDEILLAFRTDPWCMMKSEEKIGTVMDYLVNKKGVESKLIAKNSLLISLSMEKRIVPRCEVFEYCLSKGLVTNKNAYMWWLRCPETIFMKRLQRYEKEVPGVLKLYHEKMNRASKS